MGEPEGPDRASDGWRVLSEFYEGDGRGAVSPPTPRPTQRELTPAPEPVAASHAVVADQEAVRDMPAYRFEPHGLDVWLGTMSWRFGWIALVVAVLLAFVQRRGAPVGAFAMAFTSGWVAPRWAVDRAREHRLWVEINANGIDVGWDRWYPWDDIAGFRWERWSAVAVGWASKRLWLVPKKGEQVQLGGLMLGEPQDMLKAATAIRGESIAVESYGSAFDDALGA